MEGWQSRHNDEHIGIFANPTTEHPYLPEMRGIKGQKILMCALGRPNGLLNTGVDFPKYDK